MKKSDPRIFLILSAVALVAGGGFAYVQWSALGEAQKSLAAVKSEFQDEKALKQKLALRKEQLAEIETRLKHLENGVPAAAYVPTMLRELEFMGKGRGIEVLGVRPIAKQDDKAKKDKEKNKSAYEETDIEVKGRGRYEDVLAFVRGLDVFPKIVAARSVALQPAPDRGDGKSKGFLEITLMLRAYVFKDAGAAKHEEAANRVAASGVPAKPEVKG